MRVAFINNAGNVKFLFSEFVRRGHTADVFVFDDAKTQRLPGSIKINFLARIRKPDGRVVLHPSFPIARYKFFRRLQNYEIWHHYSPRGTLHDELLRHIKDQKYVKHYIGTDIRGGFDNDSCIVSTPDLLQYAPNGKWIRAAMDIDYILHFKKEVENKKPRVAHYQYYIGKSPDSTKGKQAEVYTGALSSLEKKGKCQVVNIFNQPHEKTLELIAGCDIVIGKVRMPAAWFGKFEVEGMILQKPVIASVAEDLFGKYKPPIYNTAIEKFEQDLEALIEDKTEQKRLAQEGFKYAVYHHNAKHIADEVEHFYDKA